MKTRLFAALALLSLLVGSVGFTSPVNAHTFAISDSNGENH